MKFFYKCGALTAAFVNEAASPLAESVGHVFQLHAGEEQSIAATKVSLHSWWPAPMWWRRGGRCRARARGVGGLRRSKMHSCRIGALRSMRCRTRTGCLSSGAARSSPVAMEAALKFKETCAIQAEAFSVPKSNTARWH